jgi:isoamylase
LIAEPWDCGPGGYQVGGFPPGWAEWNDSFRDTVRDFWRGESTARPLAPRLCASPDKFNRRGRKPWASANFVTAHDGFTLLDCVSYNGKHNEANGEGGDDGSSSNRSWNCGAEGPTGDKAVNALRERQMRNILATLIFAQGMPMLLAGDEFGRTQNGNNNPYCQDNEISWINWDHTQDVVARTDFLRRMIAVRAKYPILRRSRFFTGEINPNIDVRDVTWINAYGSEMTAEVWDDDRTQCFGMLMDGRAQATGVRKRRGDTTLLLVFNAHHDFVAFTLPPSYRGRGWIRLLDTNDPHLLEAEFAVGSRYDVIGRSLLLFERAPRKRKGV